MVERNSHQIPFLIMTERDERFRPNALAVLSQILYRGLGIWCAVSEIKKRAPLAESVDRGGGGAIA